MLTAAMSFCCFDSFFKRKTSKDPAPQNEIGDDVKVYPYAELKIATNIFHVDNKIGAGGFGSVYKGTLKDGTVVAVKQLSAQSKQGVQEFLTEIVTISDVQHENLVKLYGCCAEEGHRILVYEYLEKNSIAQALLGSDNTRMDMDWTMRAKICIGTARGLSYLHEELVPHIVHRDIKASNVLLDRDLNPKIADFGLAKLFPDNVTHISTRVAGTIGYLAPEYAMRGQLTKKADIYSFGVLVLEIISGRSNTKSTFPVEEQFLLEWTWQLREESRLLDIVDPRLEEYPKEEVLGFIKVALLCTQAASNFRPSMSQVVAMLSKEININENLLSRPGFMSDFKNIKVGAGTNRHAAGTNSHAFQNPQVTALHKAVSSDSNSTVDSTSIVSRSPDTITQLEPRNSESGVHLMDGVIGTRKVNCLKPNYVTFSVAVVSVSTAAMPTERESRGNEELRDRPLDKET